MKKLVLVAVCVTALLLLGDTPPSVYSPFRKSNDELCRPEVVATLPDDMRHDMAHLCRQRVEMWSALAEAQALLKEMEQQGRYDQERLARFEQAMARSQKALDEANRTLDYLQIQGRPL